MLTFVNMICYVNTKQQAAADRNRKSRQSAVHTSNLSKDCRRHNVMKFYRLQGLWSESDVISSLNFRLKLKC